MLHWVNSVSLPQPPRCHIGATAEAKTRYVIPRSAGYHFRGRGGVRWTRGKRDSNIQKYCLRKSVSHSRVPANPLPFRNTSPRLKFHILSFSGWKREGVELKHFSSTRVEPPPASNLVAIRAETTNNIKIPFKWNTVELWCW